MQFVRFFFVAVTLIVAAQAFDHAPADRYGALHSDNFGASLECGGLAPLCNSIANDRYQSGARPPHSKESPVKANPATERYVLDSSQSKFTAHALAGGLLWFKGHDHLVAVREFTGEVQLTPDSITPASLEIIAKAASMVETSDVFTEPQKQIINKELREIVLHPDQYPDIIFKSTSVNGKQSAAGEYELKIAGNLTLHGVTRPITIPAKLTVTGNDIRARGKFSIDRGDFNVKATSAFHGLVRVRKKIKFTFDIVGHKA